MGCKKQGRSVGLTVRKHLRRGDGRPHGGPAICLLATAVLREKVVLQAAALADCAIYKAVQQIHDFLF